MSRPEREGREDTSREEEKQTKDRYSHSHDNDADNTHAARRGKRIRKSDPELSKIQGPPTKRPPAFRPFPTRQRANESRSQRVGIREKSQSHSIYASHRIACVVKQRQASNQDRIPRASASPRFVLLATCLPACLPACLSERRVLYVALRR